MIITAAWGPMAGVPLGFGCAGGASLKLEHGSLKLEHGSLTLEHGSLRMVGSDRELIKW